MIVVSTRAALRASRAGLGRLGLVPTMGFLHAGHLSLVRLAREQNDAVAVSIFVNPTQFAPHEDLGRYPRDPERDLALLREAGAALAFMPEVAEIYPPGFASRIEVGPIAEPLEGAVRPGHFAGVATVVAKLIGMAQPDTVYFGQKDAQQCAVVRRMIVDLDLPVRMVVGPTVREPDGLAMSSRNAYLDPRQRAEATVLFRVLEAARSRFEDGERRAGALREAMAEVLKGVDATAIDYLSIADPVTLRECENVEQGALVSLAVRFGNTRLIDNILLN